MAKSNTEFKAIILAGGSGERFWPLSTPERPKQFLRIFGDVSLLRQSYLRLAPLVKPENIFVVTDKSLVAASRKELPELPKANVIGEPMRRDTAAAVALGVAKAGEGILGFFPADHLIKNERAFRSSLKKAIAIARKTPRIVTLGITPNYPTPSYGYINPKTGRFVEKPDSDTAEKYIGEGYLWNAGMFIASYSTFRSAFISLAADLVDLKPRAEIYEKLEKKSFDYRVMEKLEKVEVVECDCDWDDVGSYAAFFSHFKKGDDDNVVVGDVRRKETENSILIGDGRRVSVLGVKDMVVVATDSEVLVMPLAEVFNLKKLFN
ncbi:MAG: NTP transferase domain-containing protein [Kiritimatiellae bacterium]|nr:NTP transferase domain-containing protein [Kiritimatiellia bacterium]